MINDEFSYEKTSETAKDPVYSTTESACFDIFADFGNFASDRTLSPGETAIIPTGLIFHIPHGLKVSLYPRSGLSLKGVRLANSVGQIDSDYHKPVGAIVHNSSDEAIRFQTGDPICQGALEPVIWASAIRIKNMERRGGFGSTGGNPDWNNALAQASGLGV